MFEVPQDIASDPDADLGTARAIALIASLGFDEIVQSIPFPMVISLNSAGDQNGDRAEITSMSLSAKGKTVIAEGTVVVHSFGKHDATFRLEFSVAPADVWGGQSPDGAFLSIRETKFDLAFKHPVVWFLGGIVLAFVRSKITAGARDTLETQLHTTVMDRLYPGQNLKPRDVPVMVLAVEEGAQSDALELTLSVIKHPLLAGGEPQLC